MGRRILHAVTPLAAIAGTQPSGLSASALVTVIRARALLAVERQDLKTPPHKNGKFG